MWAVAYMNFFDNELSVELVKADTLIEALSKHSKLVNEDWLKTMPNDLKQLRDLFWEMDSAVDAVEIELESVPEDEPSCERGDPLDT